MVVGRHSSLMARSWRYLEEDPTPWSGRRFALDVRCCGFTLVRIGDILNGSRGLVQDWTNFAGSPRCPSAQRRTCRVPVCSIDLFPALVALCSVPCESGGTGEPFRWDCLTGGTILRLCSNSTSASKQRQRICRCEGQWERLTRKSPRCHPPRATEVSPGCVTRACTYTVAIHLAVDNHF